MLDLFCEKHRIGKAVVQDMLNARLGITNYEHEKKKKTKQIYLYRKQYAKKNIHNAYIHNTSSDMREVKGDDDTTQTTAAAVAKHRDNAEIFLFRFVLWKIVCANNTRGSKRKLLA